MSTGDPITTDTVFDIASVSKKFTATAVLLLIELTRKYASRPMPLMRWRRCRAIGWFVDNRV